MRLKPLNCAFVVFSDIVSATLQQCVFVSDCDFGELLNHGCLRQTGVITKLLAFCDEIFWTSQPADTQTSQAVNLRQTTYAYDIRTQLPRRRNRNVVPDPLA